MLRFDDLDTAIKTAATNRSKLVFEPTEQSGELDRTEIFRVNINKALSEQLIGVPQSDRAKSVERIIADLIDTAQSAVVQLTGLEILFDRSLSIDPIRLLHACAKNKTLLVRWPGEVSNDGLSYAVPSHPEYRSYRASDLSDVILLTSESVKR